MSGPSINKAGSGKNTFNIFVLFCSNESPVPVQVQVPGLHMNMSAAVSSVAARTPSRDGEPQHV